VACEVYGKVTALERAFAPEMARLSGLVAADKLNKPTAGKLASKLSLSLRSF
jgi:hypothetical protein